MTPIGARKKTADSPGQNKTNKSCERPASLNFIFFAFLKKTVVFTDILAGFCLLPKTSSLSTMSCTIKRFAGSLGTLLLTVDVWSNVWWINS